MYRRMWMLYTTARRDLAELRELDGVIKYLINRILLLRGIPGYGLHFASSGSKYLAQLTGQAAAFRRTPTMRVKALLRLPLQFHLPSEYVQLPVEVTATSL
jgi:hypothetical protein